MTLSPRPPHQTAIPAVLSQMNDLKALIKARLAQDFGDMFDDPLSSGDIPEGWRRQCRHTHSPAENRRAEHREDSEKIADQALKSSFLHHSLFCESARCLVECFDRLTASWMKVKVGSTKAMKDVHTLERSLDLNSWQLENRILRLSIAAKDIELERAARLNSRLGHLFLFSTQAVDHASPHMLGAKTFAEMCICTAVSSSQAERVYQIMSEVPEARAWLVASCGDQNAKDHVSVSFLHLYESLAEHFTAQQPLADGTVESAHQRHRDQALLRCLIVAVKCSHDEGSIVRSNQVRDLVESLASVGPGHRESATWMLFMLSALLKKADGNGLANLIFLLARTEVETFLTLMTWAPRLPQHGFLPYQLQRLILIANNLGLPCLTKIFYLLPSERSESTIDVDDFLGLLESLLSSKTSAEICRIEKQLKHILSRNSSIVVYRQAVTRPVQLT